MIQLPHMHLSEPAFGELRNLQAAIDKVASYSDRVVAAKEMFRAKNVKTNATFTIVRETLSRMCSGAQRCCYCEDSAADEVEHIKPKHLYPESVFVWENYLYACGPCNGPKNNRYAIFDQASGAMVEIGSSRKTPVVAPPAGDPVLIDPRHEDPLYFFELDILDTFQFVPAYGLSAKDRQRAIYTREVLRLNQRDLLVRARRTAYGSYVARLRTYIIEKDTGATLEKLALHISGLQRMDHPTVWKEIQRQHSRIPMLDRFFALAPEALRW